jgi:hypothetical protein
MSDRVLLSDRKLQLALGALAVSVLAVGWSFASALRIEPTGDATPPTFNTAAALMTGANTSSIEIAEIVDQNLFAPDRSAPLRRYSLSGYEDEFAPEDAVEVPKPVVLGTAVGSGARSFAMCSLNGASTVIVRVGDKVGDYTVRSIERGVVVFSTTSGERFAVDANPS